MKVTIELKTDADPSLVLGLAIEAAEQLSQDINDHDEPCYFDENTVSVES